jgi:hypothetical protein
MTISEPALTLLKNELLTDPMNRMYNGKTAEQKADLINSPYSDTPTTIFKRVDIDVSNLMRIIIPTGELYELVRVSQQAPSGAQPPTAQDQIIVAAWSFVSALQKFTAIETSDEIIWQESLATMNALVVAQILSPDSVMAISNLVNVSELTGAVEHHPRIVDVFLGVAGAPNAVTPDDVTAALA